MFNTLAVTNSVNSGHGRPEVVCHFLSSCVHTSIPSKSGSKVQGIRVELQVPEVCRRTWRWESQNIPADEEDHDFCFIRVQLKPFETCIIIEFAQLELQTFSRVWSESNVIVSIEIAVRRKLNWFEGSGSIFLHSQESLHEIVMKGVELQTREWKGSGVGLNRCHSEEHCQVKLRSLQSIRLSTSTDGMCQRTGRSIRDQRCKELITPLLDGYSTLEAFLVRRRNHYQ